MKIAMTPKEAAGRIEVLVKRAGVNTKHCEFLHWPGVITRLALWSKIERICERVAEEAVRADRRVLRSKKPAGGRSK